MNKPTPNGRLLLSGRLKKPSKDLVCLSTSNNKGFLKQYSSGMQEKLQNLKQKIQQKKKQKQSHIQKDSQKDKKNILRTTGQKLQKILVNTKNNKTKEQNKPIIQKVNNTQLEDFLNQISMMNYKQILLSHQIDTLQILNEATQKELQQIGISKGHVLKIKVMLQKFIQGKGKQEKRNNMNNLNNQFIDLENDKKNQREIKTKDSQRYNRSQLSQNSHISVTSQIKKTQSISIGTMQENQIISLGNNERIRNNRFCLFCYQSIGQQRLQVSDGFCCQQCEQHYNMMFKKYQANLTKAEHQFKIASKQSLRQYQQKSQQQQQQASDQQKQEQEIFDLLNNVHLLDVRDFQNEYFDQQEYERIKKELI